MGYQYLRKRQAKKEARTLFGTPGRFQVRKEDLAKVIAVCEIDPALERQGKERLFELEPHGYYERLFRRRPIKQYLAYHWLERAAKSVARGDRDRGYLRWLVMNLTFCRSEHLLFREPGRSKFIYSSERRLLAVMEPLEVLIDSGYEAAAAL